MYAFLWLYKEKKSRQLVSTTEKKAKALLIYTQSPSLCLYFLIIFTILWTSLIPHNHHKVFSVIQNSKVFRFDMKSHFWFCMLTSELKPLCTFICWKGSLHVPTVFSPENRWHFTLDFNDIVCQTNYSLSIYFLFLPESNSRVGSFFHPYIVSVTMNGSRDNLQQLLVTGIWNYSSKEWLQIKGILNL